MNVDWFFLFQYKISCVMCLLAIRSKVDTPFI